MATGGIWIVDKKDCDKDGIPKPGAPRKPGMRGGAKPAAPKKSAAGSE